MVRLLLPSLRRNEIINIAFALLIAVSSSSAFQPPCCKSSVTVNQSRSLTADRTSKSSLSRQRTNRDRSYRSSPLFGIVEDIESLASTAAETWSVETTPFLEPDIAAQVEERFQDRGDVIAYRVVGGRRLIAESPNVGKGEGRRCRFVLMHPDLGLDIATAEAEHCHVVMVENVNVGASNTFPNALAAIGIDLDYVGDIVTVDSSTVYFVIDPSVTKPCLRLLSKELVGVGINVSVMDDHEFMPDGEIQEMKLSRILERQMNRKKLEKGYVQFGSK